MRFCYRANHVSVSLPSQLFCVDVSAWFCYRANRESVGLASQLFCVDVCAWFCYRANLESVNGYRWHVHVHQRGNCGIGINQEIVRLQRTFVAGIMYSRSLRMLLQSTLLKLAMHCCSVHTACNLHCGFKLRTLDHQLCHTLRLLSPKKPFFCCNYCYYWHCLILNIIIIPITPRHPHPHG